MVANLNDSTNKTETWLGWDSALLELLLDANTGANAIGFALGRVIAERAAQGHDVRFACQLYFYHETEDTYRLVGTWTQDALDEDSVTPSGEWVKDGQTQLTRSFLGAGSESPNEIFLPLETATGVWGFFVFRATTGKLASIRDESLYFLGRIGGSVLEKLLESERAANAHTALGSAMRHLECVLSLAEEAILLVDTHGRIQVASEAVGTQLGRYPEDVVGRQLIDLVAPEAHGVLRGSLKQVADHSERVSREIPVIFGDASRPIQLVFQRVQPGSESEPGILVRFRSTERGSAEWWDDAETSRREIESVREKTRSFGSYLKLLRDEVKPKGRREELFRSLEVRLEALQAQADLHGVSEQFRHDALEWRDRPAKIEALFEKARSRVAARLEERNVSLDVDMGDSVPWVRVDSEQWALAVSVILDCASESARGTSLRVEAARKAGSRVELRVTPAGPSGASRTPGEIGDGLVLARKVIEHYGGKLNLEWQPDGRLAVDFDIPAEVGAESEREEAA